MAVRPNLLDARRSPATVSDIVLSSHAFRAASRRAGG